MAELLNTTVITLKWSCHKELFELLDSIPSLKNYSEYETDRVELRNFYIPKRDKSPIYSGEKLAACMEVFDCHGRKHGRKRKYKDFRFAIWHYVFKTFNGIHGSLKRPTLAEVGKDSVSDNEVAFDHASVIHGVSTIDKLLGSSKEIRQLKKEVYTVCEEIFFGKSETFSKEVRKD